MSPDFAAVGGVDGGGGFPISSKVFALVDCNNFYVSCERVFDPGLQNRPVVVLSNNDGCIIARSNEAKEIGIKMGEPVFKREGFLKNNRVAIFSSNYALYGDMSRRVMDILAGMAPKTEIYSIDEAFLRLDGLERRGLAAYARNVADTVRKWSGIPVSIGLGPTKTLAKIANRWAKKNSDTGGVFDLCDPVAREEILGLVDVGEVWGVGRRYSRMLKGRGVITARDLRNLRDDWVRKKMTVQGLHTVLELRGVSCIELEESPQPKKTVLCSRSFGRPVSDAAEMREAVSAYASRAAEKMRGQNSQSANIMVFVMTNPHKPEPQYSNSYCLRLPVLTASTPDIIKNALRCLEKIYRPGYNYKKAGVMLMGLEPENRKQLSLFEPEAGETERKRSMMGALDRINSKWGRGMIGYAAAGLGRPWKMRQLRKSPRYTTDWRELPRVNCRGCEANNEEAGAADGIKGV